MKPSVDNKENKGRTGLKMKAKKAGSKEKSSKISSRREEENFQKQGEMLKKMGIVWEEGGCLDWRNLKKRTCLQQEYEAIGNQHVATVEILSESVISSSNI